MPPKKKIGKGKTKQVVNLKVKAKNIKNKNINTIHIAIDNSKKGVKRGVKKGMQQPYYYPDIKPPLNFQPPQTVFTYQPQPIPQSNTLGESPKNIIDEYNNIPIDLNLPSKMDEVMNDINEDNITNLKPIDNLKREKRKYTKTPQEEIDIIKERIRQLGGVVESNNITKLKAQYKKLN